MRIPVHYSLDVARKIVDKINLPKKIAKDCTLSSWSNGREQGLHINRFMIGFSPTVVIAQHRCSDDILVICGDRREFDIQTNHPSEELWDKNGARVHFRYNEIDKAVKYIEDFLTSIK